MKSEFTYRVQTVSGLKNRPWKSSVHSVRSSGDDNPRDASLKAMKQVLDELSEELEPEAWMTSVSVFFRWEEE